MSTKIEISGKEWVDRWIASLNSGEYHQGIGCLYTPSTNSYCCMGVCGATFGAPTAELKHSIPRCDSWWLCDGLRIPTHVDPTDDVSDNTLADICVELNDGLKWSFKDIARWLDREARPYIEAHLDSQAGKNADNNQGAEN